MKQLLTAVCCLLTVGLPAASAAQKAKAPKPRPYAKVTAVDVASNTILITDADGNDKEYVVDQFTVIILDGKPVKLSPDLKGLKADVTASGTRLSRLELSDPPLAKPAKKKKK